MFIVECAVKAIKRTIYTKSLLFYYFLNLFFIYLLKIRILFCKVRVLDRLHKWDVLHHHGYVARPSHGTMKNEDAVQQIACRLSL